jgi:hypothetical protein
MLVPVQRSNRRVVNAVIEEMLAYRDQRGPLLGDDLTVRELIEEGRP